MGGIKIGTRVRMLRDDPSVTANEFYWRKGDIGVIHDMPCGGEQFEIDFNGVENQSVYQDGRWFATCSAFEVIE